MPDYPVHTLFFPLPEGFDKLSRENRGRVLIHLIIENTQRKFPNLALVTAEYTGSGDSWDDAQWLFYGEVEGGNQDMTLQIELHNEVHDAFDSFLEEWVSDEHPGWENNDGGFGTMTIDLKNKSIKLEHNGRYVSSELEGTHTLFDDADPEI